MHNILLVIILAFASMSFVLQFSFQEYEISTEEYNQIEKWKKVFPELNTTIHDALKVDNKIIGREFIEIEDRFDQLNKEAVKRKLK